MKKLLFIIAIMTGGLIASPAVHAQSTGITMDMIGTGQNALVDHADVITFREEIRPDPGVGMNCRGATMIHTGAEVYRWYAVERRGEWINYANNFCLTQGCHYSYSTSTSNINPITGEPEQDEEGNDREFEHVRIECVNTIPLPAASPHVTP